METIFLYTTNESKKNQIQSLSKTLGIRVKELQPQDLSKTVGLITGIIKPGMTVAKSVRKVPAFYMMPEVMLCFGMTNERLDAFLKAYRMADIEPVKLKAMVTPYNMVWSLYELVEELKEEQSRLG